jgi:predicted MPP superfamily phosphohydrolase
MLAAGGAYSRFLEPQWLCTERVTIRLKRLPAVLNGFTITQLSDLHRGPYVAEHEIQSAVGQANRLRADLIVLTGDYVSHSAKYARSCANLLGALQARFGVVAILGNHDHWTDASTVARELESQKIRVLRNEALAIEKDETRLWIAGVDDVWEEKADLALALRQVPKDEVTVLLAHEPDYADTASAYPVDLQLSGHSHGGQVRLPLLGAPRLPYLGIKYPAGLRSVGSMQVYTNRGIGVINPPVRFGRRPEITLLTLFSA